MTEDEVRTFARVLGMLAMVTERPGGVNGVTATEVGTYFQVDDTEAGRILAAALRSFHTPRTKPGPR
jgi:hypothetical protein